MPMTDFEAGAATFDEQRGFPEKIGRELRELVLSRLPASPRLLEVGIGTGRIAAPFVMAGCRYTGLERAPGMLVQCRQALAGAANLTLVLADARHVPFADRVFDAVIAASLFRVVAPWQAAAAEIRRVLAPQGSLILIQHEAAPGSIDEVLGRQKREILRRLGLGAYPTGGASDDRVAGWFADQGAAVTRTEIGAWTRIRTPRACIERYLTAGRVAGQPWASELQRQLAEFAMARYGGMEVEEPVRQTLRVYLIRMPGTAAD